MGVGPLLGREKITTKKEDLYHIPMPILKLRPCVDWLAPQVTREVLLFPQALGMCRLVSFQGLSPVMA